MDWRSEASGDCTAKFFLNLYADARCDWVAFVVKRGGEGRKI